jgi:proline dehydrogenase
VLKAYRAAMLGVAGLPPVASFVRRYGWRLGARRFVAGHDVDEAMPALDALAASGRTAIVDVLGEYVADAAQARAMQRAVCDTIDALHARGVTPIVSVKPTQLGLGVDRSLAAELADPVARLAEARGGRIALDMEDARYTDATLALLRGLWRAGHAGTSTVLQAALYRSAEDLEGLLADGPPGTPLEIRIVKGAYHEAPSIASGDLATIRRSFTSLIERAWRAGAQVNVATHDEVLITEAAAFCRGASVPRERAEFQVLFGIKPGLQVRLVERGLSVRVYVPIGHDWYGYYTRRLAERPANLAMVLRGVIE